MKMMHGMAIGVLAAAMSMSGTVSAEPATPCTQDNNGAVEIVPTEAGYELYYCNAGFGWTLIGTCDVNGCSEL